MDTLGDKGGLLQALERAIVWQSETEPLRVETEIRPLLHLTCLLTGLFVPCSPAVTRMQIISCPLFRVLLNSSNKHSNVNFPPVYENEILSFKCFWSNIYRDPQIVFRPRLNQSFIFIIFLSTVFKKYVLIDWMNIWPLISFVSLGKFHLTFLSLIILMYTIEFDWHIFQISSNSVESFLVSQWLRLHASNVGDPVWSLDGKLRSHRLHGTAKNKQTKITSHVKKFFLIIWTLSKQNTIYRTEKKWRYSG